MNIDKYLTEERSAISAFDSRIRDIDSYMKKLKKVYQIIKKNL